MSKRKRDDEDEEVTRDTPVKIALPFEEAARRLAESRQATSEDEPDSEDESR